MHQLSALRDLSNLAIYCLSQIAATESYSDLLTTGNFHSAGNYLSIYLRWRIHQHPSTAGPDPVPWTQMRIIPHFTSSRNHWVKATSKLRPQWPHRRTGVHAKDMHPSSTFHHLVTSETSNGPGISICPRTTNGSQRPTINILVGGLPSPTSNYSNRQVILTRSTSYGPEQRSRFKI